MVKVIVDHHEVEVEDSSTVFQACEKANIEIPHFCYHEKLSIAGNCRACLVEIEGCPKPIASCAFPVQEGMKITTSSEMVKRAREGVLELLLINHPLDCPVCDQGGECDLQDLAMSYGGGESRFNFKKRVVSNKNMGPLISTHMTRCIHCTRCIRFMDEVAGSSELGAVGRGEDMEVTSYLEGNITSELSGNVIDVCPVGALNNKPYAYQGRSWELEKTNSIDVLDAVGSNIRIDARGMNVMRVLPRRNDEINECWISDKTRFSYDGNHTQRLDTPYIREKGKLKPVSWEKAFDFIKVNLEHIKAEEFAALAGDLVDCESAFVLKEFMQRIGSPHKDCRPPDSTILPDNRFSYIFNSTILGIEQSDCILLVGANPKKEATLINAKIRKRFLKGGVDIASIGIQGDLTYPYEYLGDEVSVLKNILNKKHPFHKKWFSAKKPMIVLGQSVLSRRDGYVIQKIAQNLCKEADALSEDWNGYNMLHTKGGLVGCLDIGFVPENGGFDTKAIIENIGRKKIKALYLLGVDDYGRSSLGNAFVIYQGHHGGRGAENADVILPGATYMEKNALYVNTEGRVQMTQRAIEPPGKAKEDWKIIRALSDFLGILLPYDTQDQLHKKLASLYPAFSNIGRVIPEEIKEIKLNEHETLSHKKLESPIENYYMTDIISSNSQNMANCVKELGQKK